jgi:peptidoglycan/xylan/chitin deacetylase (PgdA/CDA1 family)
MTLKVLIPSLLMAFSASAFSADQPDRKIVGVGSAKLIALTFDDGPTAEVTPALLDILKANNAKATFFPIGTSPIRSRFGEKDR